MSILEWLWSWLPDQCEVKTCLRQGVRGNENIIDGVVMCDYCHYKHHMEMEKGNDQVH